MADAAVSALFDGAQGSPHKFCFVCGARMPRKRGRYKYCSRSCSRVVENEKRREKRGTKSAGDILICVRCNGHYEWRGKRTKYCEPCVTERAKEKSNLFRQRHPDKVRELQKKIDEARKGSPERVALSRRKGRAMAEKRRNDSRLRLDHRMGQLLRSGLKSKNGRTWESLVGYTLDDLYSHLERQFLSGMSWDNIGEWHIDHILPRASFDYETEDDPEFKACWALTNLRPLWAFDNLSKGAKILTLV